jgi:hypothetical protein
MLGQYIIFGKYFVGVSAIILFAASLALLATRVYVLTFYIYNPPNSVVGIFLLGGSLAGPLYS